MRRTCAALVAFMLMVQTFTMGSVSAKPNSMQGEVQVLAADQTTTVATTSAPKLILADPADYAGVQPVNGELTFKLTFDKAIATDVGSISIKRADNNAAVSDIPLSSVTLLDDRTIQFVATGLATGFDYYVFMSPGAIVDAQDKTSAFPGMPSTDAQVRFTTRTVLAPTSLEPNGTGGAVATPTPTLKMIFDKPVYKRGGYIQILNGTTTVQSYEVNNNERVLGDGTNTIEIPIISPLTNNTTYTVRVDEKSFVDGYGKELNLISGDQWTFKVATDSTAPTVSGVSPSINQEGVSLRPELVITMSESVKLVSNGSSIVLKRSNGGSVPAQVSVNNNQIRIVPNSNLSSGTFYSVDIGAGALTDLSNNPVAARSNVMTFKTLVPDTTSPVLESAIMTRSDMLELTYTKTMDSSTNPTVSSFKVTVNDEVRPLTGVSIAGNKVMIYLQSGVAIGQVIKVSYSPIGSGNLKDTSGNSASSFTNRDVTNKVESSTTRVVSSSATGMIIQFQFNETLKVIDEKALSQFLVMVDDQQSSILSAFTSGNTLTLTINKPITDGQVVKVTYTSGAYPIADRYDTSIVGFGPLYVRNNLDTKAPVLVSTQADGTRLVLNYNEGLQPDMVPMKSFYSVLVNDKARYVTKVEVKNNQVILTLQSAISSKSDSVTISYVPGLPRLLDLANNPAAAFSLVPVGNNTDTSTPQVERATGYNDKITLLFSKQLDYSSVPSASNFIVRAGNSSRTVRSVQVSNSTVTLTMLQPIAYDQNVYVSYTASSSNPLVDLGGTRVRSFSSIQVSESFDNGSSGNGSGSGSTTDSSSYTSEASWNLFLNDMLLVDTSVMKKTTDMSLSGQYVNRYNVDDSKWESAMKMASRNGQQVVALDLAESEKAVIVSIPVKSLQEMARTDKELKIGVRYGDWLYTIALKDLDYMEIARNLSTTPSNVTLLLQMEKQTTQTGTGLSNAIRSQGGSVLVEPYRVHLTAYTSVPTAKVTNLQMKTQVSYRTTNPITLEQSTMVRLESGSSNRLVYVPGSTKSENGTTVVSGKLFSNGQFAIARRSSAFSDVGGHWAASDINKLANRFIADARTGNKYEPNKPITRSEFAVLVAKSLGLDGNIDQVKRFKDVATSSAAAPYIGAAVKAGVINGNVDGTFKPNNPITREQMALMMNRALLSAGYSTSLSGSASSYLNVFTDRKKISSASQDAVARMVHESIIQGITSNTFGPQEPATRAQAAIMVKRMMERIEYI